VYNHPGPKSAKSENAETEALPRANDSSLEGKSEENIREYCRKLEDLLN